jgi:hypothetical protein
MISFSFFPPRKDFFILGHSFREIRQEGWGGAEQFISWQAVSRERALRKDHGKMHLH